MANERSSWFEAFTGLVQFYPKMSLSIAFATMAAIGRMMPTTRRPADAVVVNTAKALPGPTGAKPSPRKRSAGRKSPKTSVRRRAA